MRTLGLRPLWRDDGHVGLDLPETDAEIVLHTEPDLPPDGLVHYLVDDVVAAVRELETKGCAIVEPPFDIPIGKCAVIRDPFGVTLCILDMTKGPR